MHRDDADMPFYIGFPARRADFCRKHDRSVVRRPCLEFRVQARINPILVLGNCNLAVIRRNGLRNAAEILQSVVVHANPVGDVAAGHAFNVEKIAERQGRNKDGDLRQRFRITDVTKPQGFACII